MDKRNIRHFIRSYNQLFVLIIVLLLVSCAESNLVENIGDNAVVAEINGNDITVKKVRDEMKLLMKNFRIVNLKDLTAEEILLLKINGLNKVIQSTLLNMEAVSNNIVLANNEYNEALNELKNSYKGDSFSKFLNVQGIPLEIWENKLKNNLVLEKLIKEVVNKDILINDDKVKKYYDENQLEFKKGKQVRSLHIMVESESEIRNIIKKLKSKKEDFSLLAQAYSLGAKGHLGGDLGYFELGQMQEEFDGIFKLKVGQLSDTIKTPYGYHIFKVIDIKPERLMSFKESYKKIHNKLLRKEQSKLFDEWMLRLKNKSDIKIKYDVLAKIR